MSASIAEFERSLTSDKVEYAYGICIQRLHARDQSFADVGFRAASARDEKLLIALEKMAEFTGKAQEEQMGRTMRSADSTFGEQKGTTTHQLCREAYRLCDERNPVRNFEWIYGAAAWLCGYNL